MGWFTNVFGSQMDHRFICFGHGKAPKMINMVHCTGFDCTPLPLITVFTLSFSLKKVKKGGDAVTAVGVGYVSIALVVTKKRNQRAAQVSVIWSKLVSSNLRLGTP